MRSKRNTTLRVRYGAHPAAVPSAAPAEGAGPPVDVGAPALERLALLQPDSLSVRPTSGHGPLPPGSPVRRASISSQPSPARPGRAVSGGNLFGRDAAGAAGAAAAGDKLQLVCSVCGARGKGDSPACAECRRSFVKCALCRVAVRGAYMWCQGCGHGGHLPHMSAWFERYADCPTGCGHRCNVKTDRTMTWTS
jgi:hypothetical protein